MKNDNKLSEDINGVNENEDQHVKKGLMCTFCNKKFTREDNLKVHINQRCKTIKNEKKCSYCFKIFTCKSSLNRHLVRSCKIRKQTEKNKEEIYEQLIKDVEHIKNKCDRLEAENKELKESIESNKTQTIKNNNVNSNNNTININNNNITILPFGKENLDYLTENVYKKLFNDGFCSVPKLIEFIHFNKNHPENHNIYIQNIKENYVMIMEDKRWVLADLEEILRTLIDRKYLLHDKFDEISKKMDTTVFTKFVRFLSQYDNDDYTNRVKKEIRLLLFNNKSLPIRYRKIMDQNNVDLITQ